MDRRPKLVVDRRGKVIWSDDKTKALLAPPLPLCISDGALSASDNTLANELSEFLSAAGVECESLLLRGNDRRHWMLARGWMPSDAPDLVCLLFNMSVPSRSIGESGLIEAINLTATEARVLDKFARLNSPREIAEKLGVSISTVRSHLKQVHAKAGVESAVQLMQLVQGYCGY